jgi:hypothetical protein
LDGADICLRPGVVMGVLIIGDLFPWRGQEVIAPLSASDEVDDRRLMARQPAPGTQKIEAYKLLTPQTPGGMEAYRKHWEPLWTFHSVRLLGRRGRV